MPTSPAGEPRNMLVGHVIGSVTTVVVTKYIFGIGNLTWLSGSIAVAFTIWIEQLTGTINPPSGAAALFYATAPTHIQELGFLFVGIALAGAASVVCTAWLFNNLLKQQRYPHHGWL